MKILVTGSAGFIGFHTCAALLKKGHTVVGLDNINDYYDPALKYARLGELGIRREEASEFGKRTRSSTWEGLTFIRLNLEDAEGLRRLFEAEHFDVVCHLAAQAGVRYSLENPEAYVQSNIVGFLHILENCRHFGVKHLVYASSSSVYGANQKVPFETSDRVDHPVSLYAATKKSNELMAHTYSHLYGFATTGLRFFTVYGPWGRPDMAPHLFTAAILKGEPIKVFNQGNLERDFTYIDDIVEGVTRVVEDPNAASRPEGDRHRLYNIGRGEPIALMDFIGALAGELGREAKKEFLPMQAGDVPRTWADTSALERDYGYKPSFPLKVGVARFVAWYTLFYKP